MGKNVKSTCEQVQLDSIAAEYLQTTPEWQVNRKLVERTIKHVLPELRGKRVLELGAGEQVWTPSLLRRFSDVTTVDGSKALLDAMRHTIGKRRGWTPVHALFERFAPREKFDVVVATNVLEHVDNPALILRRAHQRWLKSDGMLAVLVPHALSLHRRLAVEMGLASHPGALGEMDRRLGHKRCFTCYEMDRILADAGFQILERQGLFAKPLTNALLANCSDAQMEGLFKLGMILPIEYSAIIFYLARRR